MDESLFLRWNLMQGEKVLYASKIHFMYDVKAAFIGSIGIGLGLGFSSLLKVSALFPVEYANVPLYVFGGMGVLFPPWGLLWKTTAIAASDYNPRLPSIEPPGEFIKVFDGVKKGGNHAIGVTAVGGE